MATNTTISAQHPFLDRQPIPRPPVPILDPRNEALSPLKGSIDYLKSLQRTDGYWWFSLEANESIGAEFIFLMHYLGTIETEIQNGIARRIQDVQRPDGTWAIYHDGPACLSTTVECYFALKIAGVDPESDGMRKAREFILKSGGIEATRVFTKIHLAMFGIVPWEAAPAMPAEFILLPTWFPFMIYAFSSWARATIVPLLVFMSNKRTCALPAGCGIDELFANPPEKRNYSFKMIKGVFSWESFFIFFDKCLKYYERHACGKLRNYSINKCLRWINDHIKKTEDIYPALAYGALALKAAGFDASSPEVRKPFEALKMFQQRYAISDVPALPEEIRDDGRTPPSELRELGIEPQVAEPEAIESTSHRTAIHQQCCISPVWDTPWAIMALLEAGVPEDDPALLRSGRWLLRKQITEVRGDWAVKNPKARPGGWAFEFENDYFPDVDDTIEVLAVLHRLALPWQEKSKACELGLSWLLSMQNDDGGWGAFDKNQTLDLVNRIPFSDHGACLDPSSPDIAGRMVEFLAGRRFSREHPAVRDALAYLWRTQEPDGSWMARWGINYVYGTWCVLTGLSAIGWDRNDPRVVRAVAWLESVQRPDGGFGESPEGYRQGRFVPWHRSVPSQTAWGLMGLVAGGAADRPSAARAAEFLLNARNADASWDEMDCTGTGFPIHFYIRYHGYRHFFPLLALARYLNK